MQYGILGWILIGLVAGALGKFIMPGKAGGGIIVTIIIGILGAMAGGFVAGLIPGIASHGSNLWNLVVATGGAVLLLFLYGLVRGR